MTNERTMECPTCHRAFLDEAAMARHVEQEHRLSAQELQQQSSDTTIGRQQDVVGRREQAGQPTGELGETPTGQGLTSTPQSSVAQPADAQQNASQDAGWAQLSSPDGTRDLGRGRLRVWYEAPGSANGVRHAQLSSYTPGTTEPHRGDTVAIAPESESERYIAKVMEYDPTASGESVVVLDWPDDELPASLRELGGE